MERIDTDLLALDILAIMRNVAGNPVEMSSLLEKLFSGPESDSDFLQLVRAVTRLRFLEMSILNSLASLPRLGPIEGYEVYRDLSKAVIMAGLVHNEEQAARLRSFYPHLLTEADIDRIRLTVRTGMSREDLSKAADFLAEVEHRLGDRLGAKKHP